MSDRKASALFLEYTNKKNQCSSSSSSKAFMIVFTTYARYRFGNAVSILHVLYIIQGEQAFFRALNFHWSANRKCHVLRNYTYWKLLHIMGDYYGSVIWWRSSHWLSVLLARQHTLIYTHIYKGGKCSPSWWNCCHDWMPSFKCSLV